MKRATPQSPTVHPAGFEHAEAIAELIRMYPDELLSRALGNIVQSIDRFLVSESEGRVVAAVSWEILPEIGAPRDPSVEIKSLAVHADYCGRGLGRALIEEAIARIRVLHPAQIIVLTFCPDFFRKLGFSEVPKEQLIHKIYTGCIACAKYDSPFTCPEVAMRLALR